MQERGKLSSVVVVTGCSGGIGFETSLLLGNRIIILWGRTIWY